MNTALTPDSAVARSSRWPRVGLVLIVLLAAGLRILFLTSQSLTADEVTDLDFARHTPGADFQYPRWISRRFTTSFCIGGWSSTRRSMPAAC